jgi:hypothetical protein
LISELAAVGLGWVVFNRICGAGAGFEATTLLRSRLVSSALFLSSLALAFGTNVDEWCVCGIADFAVIGWFAVVTGSCLDFI